MTVRAADQVPKERCRDLHLIEEGCALELW